MKTLIASALTAIALAGSASAMVIDGDHLPSQENGQSQFSTTGEEVTKPVDKASNSPEGVYSDGDTIKKTEFKGASEEVSGGDDR